MTWRINRDESKLAPEYLIAWEMVLPFKHVPIIDSDEISVQDMARKLKKYFTSNELENAANRIRKGEKNV